MLLRKIALSIFALLGAGAVLLTAAFSFGLGQNIQNLVMILDAIVLLVWLWLIWRGQWLTALIGIIITFAVGVVVLPFLSR